MSFDSTHVSADCLLSEVLREYHRCKVLLEMHHPLFNEALEDEGGRNAEKAFKFLFTQLKTRAQKDENFLFELLSTMADQLNQNKWVRFSFFKENDTNINIREMAKSFLLDNKHVLPILFSYVVRAKNQPALVDLILNNDYLGKWYQNFLDAIETETQTRKNRHTRIENKVK